MNGREIYVRLAKILFVQYAYDGAFPIWICERVTKGW